MRIPVPRRHSLRRKVNYWILGLRDTFNGRIVVAEWEVNGRDYASHFVQVNLEPTSVCIPELSLLIYTGIALIRWCATNDDSETQLRVPFLTERSQVDVTFKRPVQQIVFPASKRHEDLCGKFFSRVLSKYRLFCCSNDDRSSHTALFANRGQAGLRTALYDRAFAFY